MDNFTSTPTEAGDRHFNLMIGTLNIRNVTDRWEERKELLSDVMNRMIVKGYDGANEKGSFYDGWIMGLQEVCFAQSRNHPRHQIQYLQDKWKGKDYFQSILAPTSQKFPKSLPDPEFDLDGNAILMGNSIRIISYDMLDLSEHRVAMQVLILLPNGMHISLVNTHLHHVVEDEEIRVEQITKILNWLESDSKQAINQRSDIFIILGDLNASPKEKLYKVMEDRGFCSSYASVHGHEPYKTYPSGIVAPFLDPDQDPICLDYVWIKVLKPSPWCVRIKNAEIMGNHPAKHDSTLYPSDHYFLKIEFELTPIAIRSIPGQ